MRAQISAAEKLKNVRKFKRLLSFLRPLKWTAAVSCTILVLRILVEVVAVYFLSPVITTIASSFTASKAEGFWTWLGGSDGSARELLRVLIWLALSQLALSAMIFARSIWDAKLSMGIISSMRATVYDHLQKAEFSFYDKMSSGKLLSRALGDLDTVHGFINMSLLSILDIVVSITAYLVLLGWRSPFLLAAAVIPLPIWCIVIYKVSQKSAPRYHAVRVAEDGLISTLSENVAGRHVVRAFGSAAFEEQKFAVKNENVVGRLFNLIRWQATLAPSLQSMAIAVHIVTFIVCAILIQRKMIPIGDILILGTAMGTILGKLQNINAVAETAQRALVSGERLFEILDNEGQFEVEEDVGGEALINSRGDINFENVTFAYEANKPVLSNVNLRVRGGRVTALIGPTGSGKTSLTVLLARFYNPQDGAIYIDRQNIGKVSLHNLRRHVGFVFQETFLFSDSIRNNIRYGRMDVSDDDLVTAAKMAKAHEFIERLPDGYNTRIGEGGVQLSGGQRQRLALARALVYDPEILVLDDAMAALDASTEIAVRDNLKRLRAGRTILLITHRASSLALADEVVLLEDGRVVKVGTAKDFDLAELPSSQTSSGLSFQGGNA